MPYNQYLGFQFDSIKKFFLKYNLKYNSNFTNNNKLFTLLNRKKPVNKLLTIRYIKSIVDPWKESCVFIPLDKNNGAWCIMCKSHYTNAHLQHFNENNCYRKVSDKLWNVKKKISYNYEI